MIAAGIDVGGTKIEAQVFDADWEMVARERWTTPGTYDALILALQTTVSWCEAQMGLGKPLGVSAAGLINPATQQALTANLPASGLPLHQDLERACGRKVEWINDCRALAMSEATFGAARGAETAVGLVFGTGVAGGVVVQGALLAMGRGIGGEFGHFPLAAKPMITHGLPLLTCGCGRVGCVETYLSGPGLSRLYRHVSGQNKDAKDIMAAKDDNADCAKAFAIWLEFATEFLITLCMTIGPDVIVLGGGLSHTKDLPQILSQALQKAMFKDFPVPRICLAQGGDASGARGAALAAHRGGQHVA